MVMMTVKPGLLLVLLCELEEEETEARSFFGERGQTGKSVTRSTNGCSDQDQDQDQDAA